MKSSHPPIRRMIFIDQQIRDKKFPNCSKIAKEFEVHPKTIYRDIEYMRYQLDAPIEFDSKQNGYYYSDESYFLPSIHLRESDILSFIINEKILSQYKDTPYYDKIKNATDKILHYLPDNISTENMANFISFQQGPKTSVDQHKIVILQKAIRKVKKVKIKYLSQHRNSVNDRIVNPYLLHNHHNSWYLVAYCNWRKEERIFALNRIMSIEQTNETFKKPCDMSIEKILKDSFSIICGGDIYHVVLKFSPYQARWIKERQWHKTQKLTEFEDGSLILEMDVKGLDEVKRWVLQYGAEVEVMEPDVLRNRIKEEIEKMKKLYT